ncbi:MAG: helix-turn-helix domain-containing protein [Chloroflexota bacterium]|nr:helix-turn-helix domain-containing protein [Chloroflexota bacterium]
MRPLIAEDEATLRAIAERHGFYAPRGPHTGEGSASRLIDALLAGEVVTLALSPADRRRLVAWLDEAPPPEGRLATVLHSLAAQLRPTLPKAAPRAPAPAAMATATTASPPRHGRRGYLTTDEAARRLELSPARVQELARAGEIGRKVDGRWAFTAREIARVKDERDRRALRISLTSTGKRKRTTRRRRSSSDSGRLTRADTQALGYLDQLLAEERRLEQTYSLPFRAPQRVATTVHACTRCGQDLLLLIFGDQARDEDGLLAYGRLMHEAIVARGLPAYILGAPEGDGALDDTPSLLLQVWPTLGVVRSVTPGAWDGLLEEWSQAHCAPARPPLPVP